MADNNDISMYSTHTEGKLVIAEMFIKTLKTKIYKKMTAKYCKSYFAYLDKLVDQHNNTYHLLIKILLMLIVLL